MPRALSTATRWATGATLQQDGRVIADAVLAEVAAGGSSDSGGVPADYLGDFLPAVAAAVDDGEPIAHLAGYRALGQRAAREGVALRALLDLYLSAAWRLWRHLPPVRGAHADPDAVVVAGEVMLHAVDDAVAALTEGFQLARRALIRAEESARREFVDDLLAGSDDVAGLVHRAAGFGVDLAGPHAVLTAVAATPFEDTAPAVARVERAIRGRKADAPGLVATKDGRLVVVFAAPSREAVEHVCAQVSTALAKVAGSRLGLGRTADGPAGVLAAYRESLDALELAERLAVAGPLVEARDLLAFRVLLRDPAALADLVESTLGPLRTARGGAGPLVDTLSAYFDAGGNASAAARALHLSVRALTYRLERVRELTALDPDGGADRFALHAAVLGARLTRWA